MMYYSYVSEERVAFVLKDYVDVHFQEDITRDTLSDLSYYNPDYAARLFKKETGMSFKSYVIEKRVDLARHLLCTSMMPIHEVAEKVGYDNYSYFTRVFKRVTGKTPIEYRVDYWNEE